LLQESFRLASGKLARRRACVPAESASNTSVYCTWIEPSSLPPPASLYAVFSYT